MIEKTLQNGEKVTCYPFAPPQMLMLGMSMIYGGDYPINNCGVGYYWKDNLDVDLLRASIYEAVDRCDTMRLRFLPDETYKVVQYVAQKTEMDIELWDYSDMPLGEAQEKLGNIARGRVPMFNEELHKIAIVKLADGYGGIFMKLQHLAMDAYSIKIFITDIMEIYLNKTINAPYPKPMRPYVPTLVKELQYLKSPKYDSDKKYWFDSIANADEPIFTDYMLDNRLKEQRKEHPDHRFADIHGGSPKEGVIIKDFTAEETKAVMDTCDKLNLSITSFLSMGVRTALSVFNDNEEDVSFKMIVNRRGTVNEKKSGGIRINFCSMRSIIKPEMSFTEAVEEIENVQNEMYSHSSFPFMELLQVRHESMPKDALADSTYDSVGFSYQPLMVIPNKDEETKKSSISVWYNNGATMIPLYLTIRHRASDGGFEFVFEYKLEPDPVYDIDVFFDKMKKSLLIGCENPQVKVGDVLDKLAITQEERNGKNG